jgi:hypothetical protein
MIHYKADVSFISDAGLIAQMHIEFESYSIKATDEIEDLAISLGYLQLFEQGFNMTPYDKEFLFFNKINFIEIA